jgi:hypothetical protein
MNKILNKLIEGQTSEQIQQAFAKIRIKRGYCPNDVSVEEALGVSTETDITYQRVNIDNPSCVIVHVSKVYLNNSDNTFNQATTNCTSFTLAA